MSGCRSPLPFRILSTRGRAASGRARLRSSRGVSAWRRRSRRSCRRNFASAPRARTARRASGRCRQRASVSLSSAQASMPRSTTSRPALQYQPLISSRGSSNAREKRRQRRSPAGARSAERLDRNAAEFRLDGFLGSRRRQAQLRNAGGRLVLLGLGARAEDLHHRGRRRPPHRTTECPCVPVRWHDARSRSAAPRRTPASSSRTPASAWRLRPSPARRCRAPSPAHEPWSALRRRLARTPRPRRHRRSCAPGSPAARWRTGTASQSRCRPRATREPQPPRSRYATQDARRSPDAVSSMISSLRRLAGGFAGGKPARFSAERSTRCYGRRRADQRAEWPSFAGFN